MICGAILAAVALLWVVTRPTLSTQARMFSPSAAVSQESPGEIESILYESQRTSQSQRLAPVPMETGTDVADPERPEPGVQGSPVDPPATQPVAPAERPDQTVYEKDEKITTTRFHIVQKNETLSAISQQYYGTATRWQSILDANKLTVTDANKIRPGTKLVIP